MAEIAGLGKCGICDEELSDPKSGLSTPIRHWRGHQLAHKRCFELRQAEEESEEWKLTQAQARVALAKTALNTAKTELNAARKALSELEGRDGCGDTSAHS